MRPSPLTCLTFFCHFHLCVCNIIGNFQMIFFLFALFSRDVRTWSYRWDCCCFRFVSTLTSISRHCPTSVLRLFSTRRLFSMGKCYRRSWNNAMMTSNVSLCVKSVSDDSGSENGSVYFETVSTFSGYLTHNIPHCLF